MKEEQYKALDYIENIIVSMRDASFKCKEFAVLICSAFLTIFATVNPMSKMMVLLCAPVLFLFWIIDSFYLYKERLFRNEYKRIVLMTEEDAITKSPLLFSAKLGFKKGVVPYLKSLLCSISTTGLYFPLLFASLTIGILLQTGVIG